MIHDTKHSKVPVVFISSASLIIIAYGISKVFSGQWILSQYFSVGPLTIHYYGITMALAVGAGWWLAVRRAVKYGIDPAKADSFLFWLTVGGFVGARLYHVASSFQYYWQYPLDIIKIWHGGLSIFGALIGGFVVIVIYSRKFVFGSSPNIGEARRGIIAEGSTSSPIELRTGSSLSYSRRGIGGHILQLLDWLAPSVVLGQIIGRFGNFFNYEAFGYPTNLPWKMFVPEQFRPESLVGSSFFHPLFLYEAIGNAIILLILLRMSRNLFIPTPSQDKSLIPSSVPTRLGTPSPKGGREVVAFAHLGGEKAPRTILQPGALFFCYLFLYNAIRFGLEHLRVDSTFLWGSVRLNALVSGILFIIGLVFFISKSRARNLNSGLPTGQAGS